MSDELSTAVEEADDVPLARHRVLRWSDLPPTVRAEIEATAGARVVAETPYPASSVSQVASLLELEDGARYFVKATRVTDSPAVIARYRAEVYVARHLPRAMPTPRLAWALRDEDWGMVAFEVVDGRAPATPWDPDELDLVLVALETAASLPGAREARLAPAGPELADLATGWRSLRDDPEPDLARLVPWAADHLDALVEAERGVLVACEGESFVHGDVRADTLVLTPSSALLVDWAYASRGAPWLDLAMFLPGVVVQGVADVVEPVPVTADAARRARGGAWAAATFDAHPLGRGVHPADVRSVVAGLAGYYLHHARRPAPPGLPHLRASQRAQGAAAVAWLEQIGLCDG
ncbi:phosphotransferase [Cellulosimicrobium sp. CUA-896]|uniref:phosphotransferase n=1 Tax=Cellulosimicrobium sp. CUA-896 TaxID=1517881 RepID=UPI0009F814F0|nr:phosphotransferase [Cellulosimicrobium sp. CUA-896]